MTQALDSLAVLAAHRHRPPVDNARPGVAPSLLRNHVAWHVTVFMGLQALVLNTVLARLPSVYRSQGASPLHTVVSKMAGPQVTLSGPAISAQNGLIRSRGGKCPGSVAPRC